MTWIHVLWPVTRSFNHDFLFQNTEFSQKFTHFSKVCIWNNVTTWQISFNCNETYVYLWQSDSMQIKTLTLSLALSWFLLFFTSVWSAKKHTIIFYVITNENISNKCRPILTYVYLCYTPCCCMKSKVSWSLVFDRVLYLGHTMPVLFDLRPHLNIGLFYKSAVDLWICLGMLILFCHSLLQRANSFSRSCMVAPQLRRVLCLESLRLVWA